jgi:hypothetical protein
MTLSQLSDPSAIFKAIEEFNALGRHRFLNKYGYHEAKEYFLHYEGKFYDSKAIAGVAHSYQHPDLGPLRSLDFSGGKATVERKLVELGFIVYRRTSDNEMRYWALAASPKRYRIRDAIRNLEEDLWTTRRFAPAPGDRALIWQTSDAQGKRGIVALGEIQSGPIDMPDPDNPYWINPKEGRASEPRVLVRYAITPQFPIWLGDPATDPLLLPLSVSRAKGGSVFHVTRPQWEALMNFLGGWPGQSESAIEVQELARDRRTRAASPIQRRGLPQPAKHAVEAYAMNVARFYFEALGMKVTDVSSRASFDLLCTEPGNEIHVEVKGTTGNGDAITLTSNEVSQTEHFECALFVVSNIRLDDKYSDDPAATDGDAYLFKPWQAHRHKLTPLAYECVLDISKGQCIFV